MMKGKKGEMWSCSYCCAKSIAGIVLWLGAVAALIIGWIAVNNLAGIWGMDTMGWLLTAVVLGVLAIPCKSGGCGACGSCGTHGEGCDCGVCK